MSSSIQDIAASNITTGLSQVRGHILLHSVHQSDLLHRHNHLLSEGIAVLGLTIVDSVTGRHRHLKLLAITPQREGDTLQNKASTITAIEDKAGVADLDHVKVIAGTASSHKVGETAIFRLDVTHTAKGEGMSLILTAHKSPIAALFLVVEACTGPVGDIITFVLHQIASRTPGLGADTDITALADRVLVPGTIVIVIRVAGREAGQGDE